MAQFTLMGSRRRHAVRNIVAGLVAFVVVTTSGIAHGVTPVASFSNDGAVIQALNDALLLTNIPTLQVPLGQVALVDNYQNGGCMLRASTVSTHPMTAWPGSKRCSLGDKSAKKTVYLFGDSHANMLADVFSSLGKVHHFKVVLLAMAGCPVAALTHFDPVHQWPGLTCDAFRKSAWSMLKAAHPAAIAVADDATASNYDGKNQLISPNAYLAAQMVTLTALKRLTGHVVVFGNNAQLSFDPLACLAQHSQTITTCAASFAQSTQAQLPGLEDRLRSSGMGYVALANWLCVQAGCPLVVANTAVYFDQGHLSMHYLRLLSTVLDRRLSALGIT